jgi:transposase
MIYEADFLDFPYGYWPQWSCHDVFAVFHALKSELSIRPRFHQLESRAKAHILVSFIGCALWVTLKHLLLGKRAEFTPARA